MTMDEPTVDPLDKVDDEQLKVWSDHFSRQRNFSQTRKERCEKLMRRHKAKKWSPEKTARMVRRLMTAKSEFEKSTNAIERVEAQKQKRTNTGEPTPPGLT